MSLIRKQLAFTVEEYLARVNRVRKRMQNEELDTLLVSSPENICYLSGYQTSGYYFLQTLIVSQSDEPVLVNRGYEQRNIDAYSWLDRATQSKAFVEQEHPIEVVVTTLEERGLHTGRIGVDIESCFLPVDAYHRLERALPEAELVSGAGIVELERRLKSSAEVEHIRRACRLSEIGMQAMVETVRPGVTENEVAAKIHEAMTAEGSEFPGLPLFLSSGWRTEIPHANWTDKVIETSDTVLCELTGVHRRYAGPLLRCVSVGEPSAEYTHHAEVAAEMLSATIEAIRPGATSHEVFRASASLSEAHGFGTGARQRTGYSVGINFPPDWGEGYFLDIKGGDETELETGMTFHLPTGLRLDGKQSVAISETVLVTDDGCEVLTEFEPRGLIIK